MYFSYIIILSITYCAGFLAGVELIIYLQIIFKYSRSIFLSSLENETAKYSFPSKYLFLIISRNTSICRLLTPTTNKLFIIAWISTSNGNKYLIIKFAFLLNGLICNSYFKDGIITIKIPIKWKTEKKLISNNYFTSNNFIWNKIRNIKKVDYNGYLYNLKLNSQKPYLTEIGIIS